MVEQVIKFVQKYENVCNSVIEWISCFFRFISSSYWLLQMLDIFILILLLYLCYKSLTKCRCLDKYDNNFAVRGPWPKAKGGLCSKELTLPERDLSFTLSFWEVISKPLACVACLILFLGAFGHTG